jgi:putative MATE family efflux protein
MIALSSKEGKRRNLILNGNLWNTVLLISAPLALYALFNFLYGFFDLVIVSSIGNSEVASVVFIDEIKTAILAFGGGIAAGGSVIVARLYGAGNMDDARKNANVAFSASIVFSSIIAIVLVIFGKGFLTLLAVPEDVISTGLGYYNIQIITTAIMAINSVYFGLERAKGNSSMILYLNIIAMLIKLGLSILFVYAYQLGMTYVALASLISQGFLMIIALFILFSKKNSLFIDWRKLSLDRSILHPILILAFPVMIGKFLFSMGKVFVSSMAAFYGTSAVAALGVAIKITAGANAIPLVMEESTTAIVSQNIGNKNIKRAFKTYVISAIYAIGIGLLGMILTLSILDWMIQLFTSSVDPMYQQMITNIYRYEKFSTFTSAGIAIITGVFIGFKMTHISFLLNITRLFIIRIPLLWILQQSGVGYISLGYIMFFSNLGTMLVALVLLCLFYRKVKVYGYMGISYS